MRGVTGCPSDLASAWPEPSLPVLEYAAHPVQTATAQKRLSPQTCDTRNPDCPPSPSILFNPSTLVERCKSTPPRILSKTATTSAPESETGKTLKSSWILSGHPRSLNHSAVFLGENAQSAPSRKSAPRTYLERSSFFERIPVVTLQRPQPVMATFFPIREFPSKSETASGGNHDSTKVAASIIPDAPAPIIAIRSDMGLFGFYDYRRE